MDLVRDKLNVSPSDCGTAHAFWIFLLNINCGEGTMMTTDLFWGWGCYVVQTASMFHTLTTQHKI